MAFMPCARSKSAPASSGCTASRLCRSPPAKKVFFSDVTITPVMRSRSASIRSTAAAWSARKTVFMVLADWPGMSIVRVTMPSASCWY
ncbi:hypothetical protein FQZ97_1253580 [compost metagenome]